MEPTNPEETPRFVLSEQDLALYREMGRWSQLDGELDVQARTAVVDTRDQRELEAHLIIAHGWSPHDFFRDESERERVPGLSPIDWGEADRYSRMPALTLRDMQVLHTHEHDVLYPTDWQCLDRGYEHQHLA